MEAFLVATALVAFAEIGDKTQLLALLLTARFRRPGMILLGILLATLANHAAAGMLGAWIGSLLTPPIMRWVLGLSFIAMALWALIPDKMDTEEAKANRYGAFFTTLTVFFLAEIGDKTQLATVALAGQFSPLWAVVAGSVTGLMLANLPAVLLGDAICQQLPLRTIRIISAGIFILVGLAVLAGFAQG